MKEETFVEKAPLEWHEGDMPYSTIFGDHFYCRTDGRAECGHVFINANRLHERWANSRECVIGELGFGTGLNFCETLRQWRTFRTQNPDAQPAFLHFVSFELYPMTAAEIAQALARWPEIEAEREALVTQWPQEPNDAISLEFSPQAQLTVLCGDALDNLKQNSQAFDAWYLDGFAPSRNPAMWSQELMDTVFEHTKPGGSFGTYAAAGFVRRNLQAAGFAVERRPGFAGKREMLCGTKSTK